VPAPPVYLDECVDVALAEALQRRGFTVTLARDHGPLAAGDDEQIAYATRRGWVILSHNARHFQRWHRTFLEQGRPHGGIILIPDTGPISRLSIRAAMMLDWIGRQGEPSSRLFKWGSSSVS
jgi:predicted nuclease of predicted toxin-antitoxin system